MGLIGIGLSLAMAATSAAQQSTLERSPLSYAEADARLRSTSSLTRAADYGVEAARNQAEAAAGLRRPTVAIDAQAIRYHKSFDLSLTKA